MPNHFISLFLLFLQWNPESLYLQTMLYIGWEFIFGFRMGTRHDPIELDNFLKSRVWIETEPEILKVGLVLCFFFFAIYIKYQVSDIFIYFIKKN